jgi:hypothetical protein
MTRLIDNAHVDIISRGLLGAVDVDGGPTDEQRRILEAIVAGFWERPDIDLTSADPAGPDEVALVLTDDDARERFHELLVLCELTRHPLTEAQVQRVEAYAAALGSDGPDLQMTRDLIEQGAAGARHDNLPLLRGAGLALEEPSLRGQEPTDAEENRALAARLRALQDLPVGTLGHEFVAYYDRNGIPLPGEDPDMPTVYIAHDMNHVISGYEPTGQGEIALGAMQLAMTGSHVHWVSFLGNLAVHEVGIIGNAHLSPKEATLAREGAPELVADAFRRGTRCTADFSTADHLSMVELTVGQVRERFGVPPLGV